MRNPIAAILAITILASVIMIPGADADMRPDDYPTEPVVLYFYDAGSWSVLYRMPGPVGGGIPDLPPGCVCWARSDTREVVTSETTFEPGSYLIEAYGTVPEPWSAPTPSNDDPDNTLSVIAIVLSSVAIITSGVAIVMMIRRK